MAYKDVPEFCAPQDQRCEAMTRGVEGYTFQTWRKHPHQCVRRANQSREGHAVCHIHARAKTVSYVGTTDDQGQATDELGVY